MDRPFYLSQLEGYIESPMAKVLTGMRRSGKSVLLRLLRDRLVARGASPEQIVYLNFDAMEHDALRTAAALNDHVVGRLPADRTGFVLLDEVQNVDGWERVVNSLIARGGVDVYVTGSNSTLLSSELATFIAGRYVSLEVATLSFSEFVTFARAAGQAEDIDAQFSRYLARGGFPGLFTADYTDEQARQIVTDIWGSAVIRDVIRWRAIRSPEAFERIARFALDNIGNPFSARRVAAFLKSQSKTVSHETVAEYLAAMAEAYLVRRVPRFDLRGREHLASTEKYYAGDHGLVGALLGHSPSRLPGLLENVVQAELRLRGYEVSVGKLDENEVDFVAQRRGERIYLQVTTTALDQSVMDRELRPLRAIRDSHPRYLLSMDRIVQGNEAGVRHRWIPEFLLDEDWSR